MLQHSKSNWEIVNRLVHHDYYADNVELLQDPANQLEKHHMVDLSGARVANARGLLHREHKVNEEPASGTIPHVFEKLQEFVEPCVAKSKHSTECETSSPKYSQPEKGNQRGHSQ